MRKPLASLSYKLVAVMAALTLACSMVPLAWADNASAATAAGIAAGSAAEPDGAEGAEDATASDVQAAPEASAQSTDAKAASGSAGGTTVSIQVYRSSFPIVAWVLKPPDDKDDVIEPTWSLDPDAEGGILPDRATPGQTLALNGAYDRTMEPEREGYIFAGWSTNPTDPKGGFLDSVKMPEGAPETGSYTLYALWTPKEYAVVIDLTKNPDIGEGPLSDDSFDLNWPEVAATSRKVVQLDAGRYLVSGLTVKDSIFDPDYDDATGLITLPQPARSGYRFLGWAEPAGQGVARDIQGGGFGLNLVRLTQVEGTPVLTARWATGLGVTAPVSVTFGDYDKTGAPGNPWLGDKQGKAADDTTQSEQDNRETGEYEKGGQAYFENTGWHDAVKLVALDSERDEHANEVLTTYDSSVASEDDVLGTSAGTGEYLLSLYKGDTPSSATSALHFRLSDALFGVDLDAFTMGALGSGNERIDVSYGLNLSTDPTDPTGTRANHGLVLPTNDYEKKPIAHVSYTFAIAEDAYGGSVDDYCFTTVDDDGRTLSLTDIKTQADMVAAGEADMVAKYQRWMEEDHRFTLRWYDNGLYELDGGLEKKAYTEYAMRIIGINHDDKSSGGKAGLTFQMVGLLKQTYPMHTTTPMLGGWKASDLRRSMAEGAIYAQSPVALRRVVEPVEKLSNNSSVGGKTTSWAQGAPTPTTDRFFVASFHEQIGDYYNNGDNEAGKGIMGWLNSEGQQYEYWKYRGVHTDTTAAACRPLAKGADYWQRTYALRSDSTMNCVTPEGRPWGNLLAVTDSIGVPLCFCL